MMNGGPITWASRLQKLCAQSSAESEIIAVVDSVKEALHIKLLCEESGIRYPNIPMEIQEDNNACIHMAHNLRGSQQAKHFELRLRFLNEHVHMRKTLNSPVLIQLNNLLMVSLNLSLCITSEYSETGC